jgi:hypothetical protein
VRFYSGFTSEENIKPVQFLVASNGHDGRKTVVKPTLQPSGSSDVPFFLCFLMTGLVLPVLDFCEALMGAYGLCL